MTRGLQDAFRSGSQHGDERRSEAVARYLPVFSSEFRCRPLSRYLARTDFDAFLSGIATLNIFGCGRIRYRPSENDLDALGADWLTVGEDFRTAAEQLARQLRSQVDDRQEALFDADEYTASER